MTALGLVMNSPAIRGEYLKVNFAMPDALAQAIAKRAGIDLDRGRAALVQRRPAHGAPATAQARPRAARGDFPVTCP